MRFFVSADNIDLNNKTILITGNDAVHISGSLRLKKGDIITVTSSGFDYASEIIHVSRDEVKLSVINSYKSSCEPDVKVTLFQAFPKHGKMELIIEKCIELGVYEIVPVITRYTIVKINDRINEKIIRFNKIAESAAKQCNRAFIPKVTLPVSFNDALLKMKELDIGIAAYEKETDIKMKHVLIGFKGSTAGLMTGPEGGFSEDEAIMFKQNNIHTVNLGKRILRAETAGFTCLTIFFNETGEF